MNILEEIGLYPELHMYTSSAQTFETSAREGAERAQNLREKALWIPDAVRENRLQVFPVPGRLNVADVFSQALPRERFTQLTDVIGVRGPSRTTR